MLGLFEGSEDAKVIGEEAAADWNVEVDGGVTREFASGGYLDEVSDTGYCGYCGRVDGASVMAVDLFGVVSCWKCAERNGLYEGTGLVPERYGVWTGDGEIDRPLAGLDADSGDGADPEEFGDWLNMEAVDLEVAAEGGWDRSDVDYLREREDCPRCGGAYEGPDDPHRTSSEWCDEGGYLLGQALDGIDFDSLGDDDDFGGW